MPCSIFIGAGQYIVIVLIVIVLGCASRGRVLHVENWASVPYTAEDIRLKNRIVRSLLRNRLLLEANLKMCKINIMELDNYYYVEVWPDGLNGKRMFRTSLKKPLLIPGETHFDFRNDSITNSVAPAIPNGFQEK